MANLRELRTRIASVKSTRKITSAMKMISAARLRQAQDAVAESGYYMASLSRVMNRLSMTVNYWAERDKEKGVNPPRFVVPELIEGRTEQKKHLVIVYSSSRGLCGGFNINIAKKTAQFVRFLKEQGCTVQLVFVGTKAAELLNHEFHDDIKATFSAKVSPAEKRKDADKVAAYVIDAFYKKEIDACTIIYNHFNSAISQEVRVRPIVPVKISDTMSMFTGGNVWGFNVDDSEGGNLKLQRPNVDSRTKTTGLAASGKTRGKEKTKIQNVAKTQYRPSRVVKVLGEEDAASDFDPMEYDLEPEDPVQMLTTLLPEMLATLVYISSLQSSASENGARMTAMDNATNNAADIIDDLTLSYNRKRQALITNELTEIISGAEAL